MICLAMKDFVLPASVKIAPGFKYGNIFFTKGTICNTGVLR